jgi:chromosome partitioning protein
VQGLQETCSVCGTQFQVQFRYQTEPRKEGIWYFCSQRCLDRSRTDAAGATCDACGKVFRPELAAQVLYQGGNRKYACDLACRAQLAAEARGLKLGDVVATPSVTVPAAGPAGGPAARPTVATETGAAEARASRGPLPSGAPTTFPTLTAPTSGVPATLGPAEAVMLRPAIRTDARADHRPEPRGGRGVPRVIAVFNHKGGTGKTTTSVSLAAGLAQRGKRVLLIDTDSQGNVSVCLGATGERNLYHVLVMGLRTSDAVQTVRTGLDLLPANDTLAAAELYLTSRQNRERVLRERLGSTIDDYDYTIVDCSPSLSLMNQNALVLADSVLVPVGCDYLSLVGVRQVVKTVKNVNAALRHPVQIWGVLPTFFDARAKICREAVATMQEHFAERCLSPIRSAIKVKEAPAKGQTVFEYAPGTTATDDYLQLVDRVIRARAGLAPKPEAPRAQAEA